MNKKRYVLIAFLIVLKLIRAFSQSEFSNYNNQNGTIIEYSTDSDSKRILRKHIQRVFVSDETSPGLLEIYEKPLQTSTIITKVCYGQTIDVINVLTIEKKQKEKNETWLKISMKNITGWIYFGIENPYKNNKWEIVQTIQIGSKHWTIRKLEQGITIWNTTNVYEKPGLLENKILFTIKALDDNEQINLMALSITEEVDVINGKTDNWAYINYQNRKGWIFCGDATVERGGPKYLTPENVIGMYFSIP